jgi:hypothetical protein
VTSIQCALTITEATHRQVDDIFEDYWHGRCFSREVLMQCVPCKPRLASVDCSNNETVVQNVDGGLVI